MASVAFLGIVNCTPDSFSDGGICLASTDAIAHARALIDAGARGVDIGGDASGPGSVCTGPEVEWQRIGPVLAALGNAGDSVRFSVDTHHAETAQQAIHAGAWMINDVSGGADPAMFAAIADSTAHYTCMFSCWTEPHVFAPARDGSLIEHIEAFFVERIGRLKAAGVPDERIILDPGMGGFLGPEAGLSIRVLQAVPHFSALGYPLMIGISRKRFLHSLAAGQSLTADALSAEIAFQLARNCSPDTRLYFRVHDVAAHIQRFADQSQPLIETGVFASNNA